MDVRELHPWDVDTAEARRIQTRLASAVVLGGAPPDVRAVAGADIHVARSRARSPARAAVVVLSYPELELIECVIEEGEVTFPYVPGLLSFRETPILLRAFRRLRVRPDLLLVDGQGYAHPRRFGLACHLGLLLDVPAVGCAKSRLIGEHGPLAAIAGSRADLTDGGERIGSVVRTRDRVKPLYVSPGHRAGFDEAVEWVLRCCRRYRLPQPTRLAHQAAGGHLEGVALRAGVLK